MIEYIRDTERRYPKADSKQKKSYAMYMCPVCNKEFEAMKNKAEQQKSCGKCKGELRKTHGLWGTRTYRIWDNMKQRCSNENSDKYRYYGGKGIRVCDEWNKFEPFHEWAMANGYDDKLTIDRIDGDGDYEPDNCRWATITTQSRNTRKIQTNNKSGYRGVAIYKDRFTAQLKVNYKKVYLGIFIEAIEAAKAYDEYVKENKLEHTLNFPS